MATDPVADVVADGLAREYRALHARVHELAAPLSDAAFWSRPFPFGNSFGHLVLHLTGNLSYYIGARVAGTGYIRDRDREFAERGSPPKTETLRRLDAAVEMVIATVLAQAPADLPSAYASVREPDARCRFDIFLKCAVHFYHHVGQRVYLVQDLRSRPF